MDAERNVKRLVADYEGEHDHGGLPGADSVDIEAGRLSQAVNAADDAGSDDDEDEDEYDELRDDTDHTSMEAVEDQFRRLEEEVAVLVADVHDLALYTKVS